MFDLPAHRHYAETRLMASFEPCEERDMAVMLFDACEAVEALQAEVAVARERLGPGGYRILVEVATLRAENARLKTVVDAAKEIVHCTDCDLEGDGHMTRLVRAVRALTPATSKEPT